MRNTRVLLIGVLTLTLFVGNAAVNPAVAAAALPVSTDGNLAPGSTVKVRSSFWAPQSGHGRYLVDTEVFSPSGERVAQWFEIESLTGQANVRTYEWSTSGLSAGTYRVAQGIFRPDWSDNQLWKADAGTIKLTHSAPVASSSWKLGAWVGSGDERKVSVDFTAPSSFNGRTVVLDTEIYSGDGRKVAQWSENTWLGGGQHARRSYVWKAREAGAGSYTVKMGVFTEGWSRNLSWRSAAARVLVSSDAPAASTPSPTTAAPQPPAQPTVTTAPKVQAQSAPSSSGNNSPFWADPNNFASKQAAAWRNSRPADAALMEKVSSGGAAVWLGGWNADVRRDTASVTDAASSAGKTPVFVAYNIPGRDCGSYSAGGLANGDAYRGWVRSIASGIGNRRAVVVLEPDALSQLDCLGDGARNERLSMLRDAVNILSDGGATVYLDAGHPGWHGPSVMADRLQAAGVGRAKGFALNVSNFNRTSENVTYGEAVSDQLGGKRYVIDTSRNGRGGNGEWCNPRDRAIGELPTTNTGAAHADAFLWIKRPGESDGSCNGGPGAGEWWADYALELARNGS